MTDDEFNEQLESAVDFAERTMIDSPRQQYIPTLLILTSVEQVDETMAMALAVVLMPEFTKMRRHDHLFAVGHRFGDQDDEVDAIFLISEVWLDNSGGNAPLSEAVAVAGLSADGRAALGHIMLGRDGENQLIPQQRHLFPYGGEMQTDAFLCRAFYTGYLAGRYMIGSKRNGAH